MSEIVTTRRGALALGLGAAGLGLGLPALPAWAAVGPAEKPKLTLGVGGKNLLYYLPLTVAERMEHFKAEGLEIEINDFAGGSRSLQALIGGSVDAVAGAYEHTIRMQAKGQDVRAIVELGRFPGIVVAVRKEHADKIKSAADLKGMKIGVTAPGSSTYITALYAMSKHGLAAKDAAFIGVGGGASAVAAMKKGEIDAISHLDPVISKLEADGDVVALIDTRTEAGTRALFGGSNPAAVCYLKGEFIAANPNTCQRLTNAFLRALRWLATATPAQVADLVPPAYHLGDRELYLRAVKASLESYSRTGIAPRASMESALAALKSLDPELASASFDVGRTFEERFAKAAAS